MAKEFKQFDSMFSASEIASCRKYWLYSRVDQIAKVQYIEFWKYRDLLKSWDNATIRECVYLKSDVLMWQVFRVSMKGLSTREKLFMLEQRYDEMVLSVPVVSDYRDVEQCRIENYLGALTRGGQLDTKHNVVR